MIGILNINKPKGITSFDVVAAVKKTLGTKAVGHFGTLDPMGEGVLPIGVGKATRLFDIMLKKDKIYEATFKFGYCTDTLDSEGQTVVCGGRIPCLSEITDTANELIGRQLQRPPAYSAKNINGRRAYELARQGKEVELAPCNVEIYAIKAETTGSADTFKFTIHCSSGTYIRSVCRDLAEKLGTYAVMTSIKRLRCGAFDIKDSVTLQELSSLKENALLKVDAALTEIPKVTLCDDCYEYLLKGLKMQGRGISYERFALYCKNELFGIAKINENDKIDIISYLRD